MNRNELIEELASIEHERWSRWQSYLHAKIDHDGRLPTGLIERWTRQINTPYDQLTELEKQSDREQVLKYLPFLDRHYIPEKTTFIKGNHFQVGSAEMLRIKDKKAFALIKYQLAYYGKQPSLAEINKVTGGKSSRSAVLVLNRLVTAGLIRRIGSDIVLVQGLDEHANMTLEREDLILKLSTENKKLSQIIADQAMVIAQRSNYDGPKPQCYVCDLHNVFGCEQCGNTVPCSDEQSAENRINGIYKSL